MKMRLFLYTLLILLPTLLGQRLAAQVYDVDTLRYNGDPSRLINVVILGDGYTSAEMTKFVTDAQNINNYIFTEAPYSFYKNYFNVFLIKTPSVASGAKHPNTASDCTAQGGPAANPNNFYGSTFDYYGVHRAIYPTNTNMIASVLANNFPAYDLVMMLVNTPYYGGTGGDYATIPMHSQSRRTALHELGHTFAGLSDEYWPGYDYVRETPNMTAVSQPTTIKWKAWLMAGSGIGIHKHDGQLAHLTQQWYKPTSDACLMENSLKPLCAVCTDRVVETIHQLAPAASSFSPSNIGFLSYCDLPPIFSVRTLKPMPNTLQSTWKMNDVVFKTGIDSVWKYALPPLKQGLNKLTYEVVDATLLTRAGNHVQNHTYKISWNIFYDKELSIISLTGKNYFCEGDSIKLGVNKAKQKYLWNNGDTTATITVSKAGTYQASISDNEGGCKIQSNLFVVTEKTWCIPIRGNC